MKRGAWLLSFAGLLKMLTGCATSGDAKMTDFKPVLDQGIPTGFLNKTLSNGHKTWRYVVYVPHDYSPNKEWPLIIFLHGAGERGSDGLKHTQVGIGAAIRLYPERFPAIVLFPQCPDDGFWDLILDPMETALQHTREAYKIDPKRIYLTGLSMGGFGAWIWGAEKSDTFAALIPICGGGDVAQIEKLLDRKLTHDFGTMEERTKKLATLPIWAFHGAKDPAVPPAASRTMVELVKKAGGNVKYTEFPHAEHNSWDDAYQDEETAKWLFKQHK
ncbi:MAG TPA: prolyl oligopeptidase family serine peptidase [Candidatus Hydrogenedentes bacterium]|nr:prolyl oligopeptidase family serine peptidase [Candidatus Hydrogenedentota bacterium]